MQIGEIALLGRSQFVIEDDDADSSSTISLSSRALPRPMKVPVRADPFFEQRYRHFKACIAAPVL
jgi:hypothetical protein